MKKAPDLLHRVGLVANPAKPAARQAVRDAARLIRRSGRTVLCDAATAEFAGLKSPTAPGVGSLTRRVDLLLVFGGDGTILQVAREMNGSRTPVLGVNLGGLGFLTDVPSSELPHALRQLWNGDYRLDPRALLEFRAELRDRSIHATALNDVVVSRGIVSRLVELEVSVDREVLTIYRCDGLIVSSPTGSTAYSLSAGGAIVSPTAKVVTLTPICPHTLSNRSVIVSLDSEIQVRVLSDRVDTMLSADGRGESELRAGDLVSIRRSPHSLRLVHLGGTSFFHTLRHKLQWRGSTIPER